MRWSFLYRIPYRIWFETSMGLGQCGPELASIKAAPRANVASIIIRFYIDAGKPSKGPSRRVLKIRSPRRGCSPSPGWGCGLGDSDGRWAPENSDSIHYTKWLGNCKIGDRPWGSFLESP